MTWEQIYNLVNNITLSASAMFDSIRKIIFKPANAGKIIRKVIRLKGTLRFSKSIRVDGNFEGDVITSDNLHISKQGCIKGNVKAQNAVISGAVYGNINILGKLELFSSAKIYGNIKTNRLIVHQGAVFQGSCCCRRKT